MSKPINSITENPLPSALKEIIIQAEQKSARLMTRNYHAWFEYIRLAIERATENKTHSFYIGILQSQGVIAFPYNYDNGKYITPNIKKYINGGLTARLIEGGDYYWSVHDNCKLLHQGNRFGYEERASAEAIAVPIIELIGRRYKRVIGVISILSYQKEAYSYDIVHFLHKLANILALTFARHREIKSNANAKSSELDNQMAFVVNEAEMFFDAVLLQTRNLRSLTSGNSSQMATAIEELCIYCEQYQTELIMKILIPSLMGEDPFIDVTDTELKVAKLLVNNLSNVQIAERLSISPFTVKTHLHNISKKLETKNRHEIADKVRGYGPH